MEKSYFHYKGQALYKCLLVFIILSGIIFRLYWMFFHFTHYDDVGFINCLVRLSSENKSFINFFQYGWTYAPLQVFFSQILVNPSFSYIVNIALGRFPSFLSGSASILLTYFLTKKYFSHSDYAWPIQLLSVIFIATSWENIIYSAQAEPYEIGVLVVLILTIYLNDACEKKTFSVPWVIALSLFSFYSQYHSVIILAPLYFSIFLNVDKKGKFRLFLSGTVSAILSLPLLSSFLNRGMLKRGVNWNAGINEQFLFPYELNIKELISIKTLKWFAVNTYIYLHSFFISNQFNGLTKFLTIIFGLVCLLGLVNIHRRNKELAIYIDIIALEFIGLVVAKKLTFSPSRHTLIFYPLVLLVFCYGIELGFSFAKRKYVFPLLIWGVFMSGVYIQSSINEIPLRRNRLLSGTVEEYIEKYQPKGMVSYYGFDLQLMSFSSYHIVGEPDPLDISACLSEKNAKSEYIMLLGVGNPIDQIGQARIDKMNEQFPDIMGDQCDSRENISQFVVDRYEYNTYTEVEYSGRYFRNTPHGLYIYILKPTS